MSRKRDSLKPLDLYGQNETLTSEELMVQRDKIYNYLASMAGNKGSMSYHLLETQYKLLEQQIMIRSIDEATPPPEEGVVWVASENPNEKNKENEEQISKKRRIIRQKSARQRSRWDEN